MKDPERRPDTSIELADHVLSHSHISVNVGQEFIATTVDKLELCLIRHQHALQLRDRWVAPAGILATVLPAVLGADFTTLLGIEGAMWQALYTVAAVASAIWLLAALVNLARSRKRRGVAFVISEIRRSNPAEPSAPRPVSPDV